MPKNGFNESALKTSVRRGWARLRQASKQGRGYLTIGYLENLETRPTSTMKHLETRRARLVCITLSTSTGRGVPMASTWASNRQPSQGIMSLLQTAKTSELLQHQPVLPGQLLELLPLLLDEVLERLALAPALSQLRLQSAENRGFRGR